MDDFFSESKPDLINKKTLHHFEKIISKAKNIQEPNNISWTNYLYNFYEEYLKHNMFFIIVIVLLTIFLIYKYMTKPKKDKIYPINYPDIINPITKTLNHKDRD